MSFSERNPVKIAAGAALGTLRERLAARGRLEDFERRLAERRRERIRNPQIETDDTYRALQRLNSQKVINQYFGISGMPSALTGYLHHNPSVEAMGGHIGRMINLPVKPLARDESGSFAFVDTEEQIKKSIPDLD